jgi:hypothetical protein
MRRWYHQCLGGAETCPPQWCALELSDSGEPSAAERVAN